MQQENSIEFRKRPIENILGHAPKWITRYGISIIFTCMLIIILGSMFFPYPETISCPLTITSSNSPIHLIAQTSGRIRYLAIEDKERVKKNQLLAVMDNPADIYDIQILENYIDTVNIYTNISFTYLSHHLKLGEITPYFLDLEKAIQDYKEFEKTDRLNEKIKALYEQLDITDKYQRKLLQQSDLSEKDYIISKKHYERDSLLFHKDIVTKHELDLAYSQVIQKEQAMIFTQISMENVSVQLSQLKVSLIDLEKEYIQSKRILKDNINTALQILKSQIESWKKKYVFISPRDGIISLSKSWSEDEWVIYEEPLLSVLPEHQEKIITRMEIPIVGSGKVKIGQKVIIKLDNYPYLEFGVLTGTVISVSLIPYNDIYMAEVEIPSALKSNYGFIIPFNQEMKGNGNIIITHMSLFETLIKPLRSSFNKNY